MKYKIEHNDKVLHTTHFGNISDEECENIRKLYYTKPSKNGGIYTTLISEYTIYRDKILKGVSIISTIFFTTWGIWNLYYYPSLSQWASFWGGVLITCANLIWVGLMIHYYNKNITKVMI